MMCHKAQFYWILWHFYGIISTVKRKGTAIYGNANSGSTS